MTTAFLLFTFWLILSPNLMAREKASRRWVYFKERSRIGWPQVSQKTMLQRARLGLEVIQETDFAPNPAHLQSIQNTGATLRTSSRWLNAVCIEATPDQLSAIAELGCVKSIAYVGRMVAARHFSNDTKSMAFDSLDMAMGLRQIGVPTLKAQGLTGRGITVGLIDAGYADGDKAIALKGLFSNDQILATRDFVSPERPDFYRKVPETLDDHATEVLSLVAGYDKEYDKQIGAALGASFVLARTDDAISEKRIEEDRWLAALEWMDSLGVQLINTSLGYALGFDDPKENHNPAEMDGKTTIATQAVNLATQQKGIVVVVSAGNDGNDARWQIISAPADAPDALAVGATFSNTWTKMGYSGIGPASLGFTKPDVACYSLLGTSFSAPVITGFIACLMEKAPGQPVKRWLEVVRGSGHLHGFPNNYLGHGVPNAAAALRILAGQPARPEGFFTQVEVKGSEYKLPPGRVPRSNVVVFHKKDNYVVLRQQSLSGDPAATITVVKAEGARRSTVAWPGGCIEVVWK